MISNKTVFLAVTLASMLAAPAARHALAQEAEKEGPVIRGSLVEDRAARKLLEAGDVRYESDEIKEALEVWKSVIERYPRSRLRFEAHMRLGNYYLERDRAYDRARAYFEAVISEENRDDEMRAEATLKQGICFYEARLYGKCFTVMRDVIEKYPVSPQVNQAYHYIGLAHFQLGHYSRAIDALEKVGTALEGELGKAEKVEAGKRFFVKIDDADLAALEPGTSVKVRCKVTSGDEETLECFAVGRNVRVVLGSMLTRLGKPIPDDGQLEVKGDDKVTVTYVDSHTADKSLDRPVLKEVRVVGNGATLITDGAFQQSVPGVVLGKPVNIQITDADHDLRDEADTLKAVVEVYRRKTDEEVEAETAAKIAAEQDDKGTKPAEKPAESPEVSDEEKVDRYKLIDRLEVAFTETTVQHAVSTLSVDLDEPAEASDGEANPSGEKPAGAAPDAAPAKTTPGAKASGESKTPADAKTQADAKPASDSAGSKPEPGNEQAAKGEPGKASVPQQPVDDGSIHSGVFRATVALEKSDSPDQADDLLQALPGDLVRVTYLDELNMTEGLRQVQAQARCVEGNIGGVRVTKAVITDEELRLKTRLRTADALTNIGNRYKEFGLKTSADSKYQQALEVCDEIMGEARKLGGSALEQTYVQLWKIYFEMDRLDLASAMCQRLQREFPTSGFVDEALLALGDVARKQGDVQRAIGIYNRLVAMETSQLRGEAQFGIAECYETMAEAATGASQAPLFDRAFQEYKKVFDQFPDSGRIGEAVAKMANYYYKQKDYARAIDTFETVLNDHPDAKFLDVVLFNYGRCLYRMGRRDDAQRKFDQLIADYPQSTLAGDAKKIAEALAKAAGSGS